MSERYDEHILKSRCPRCDGCGQLANDDDGTPWSEIIKLPLGSSAGVLLGFYRPIPCPDCRGTGQEEPNRVLVRIVRRMAQALAEYTNREQWFQTIHHWGENTGTPGMPVPVWAWIDQRIPWEIGRAAIDEAKALGLLTDDDSENE